VHGAFRVNCWELDSPVNQARPKSNVDFTSRRSNLRDSMSSTYSVKSAINGLAERGIKRSDCDPPSAVRRNSISESLFSFSSSNLASPGSGPETTRLHEYPRVL